MSRFYSNITLRGPDFDAIVAYLKDSRDVAYVAAGPKGAVVVFHEDMSGQENLASRLSAHFSCPAILVMGYGEAVLLYNLYQDGEQIDAYVSSPHEGLELDGPAPAGSAAVLCAAFEAERFERRVGSVLRKEAKPGQPYAYAINRHGELCNALGLPAFAAGPGYAAIDMGELPGGAGFSATEMVRTG